MADPDLKKHTFMIDFENLNTLNTEGCPACRHKFTLDETVVLACGAWGGRPEINPRKRDGLGFPQRLLYRARMLYFPQRLIADRYL